uniref:Chloride channel protein n=1 Tax=Rhodothermus marinus TaxID=29549 RepID=A0A7V2AZ45_RHOMR
MARRNEVDATQLFRLRYPRSLWAWTQELDWRITGRWMFYAVLIGVLVAFWALLFSHLVSLLTKQILVDGAGYALPLPRGEGGSELFDLKRAMHPTRRWVLLLAPTLGGLLVGWIIHMFASEAETRGTDSVIRAFHHEHGVVRPRLALVQTIGSALTIGTGGSSGREGPIAQIGAALSTWLAQRFRLRAQERRLFLIAGMAAGIGSIFRSPLGGAFFAVEVLYREDLESEGLMPAIVASITAYSVYTSIERSSTIFATPHFTFVNPLELLPLVGFAVYCAVMGILFVRLFFGIKHRLFGALPFHPALKPAFGGCLVGIIAFFFPAVMGSSYGWLQQAILGNLPLSLMALLALLKMLATAFTVGSGQLGGTFAPSLVIGGMLGGLYGEGMHRLMPELITQPEAYVLLGMTTFFAGAANVPITATIMISELTGSYTLLVPQIFSSVIAHLVARRWSLFPDQVRTHNESPAHQPLLRLNLLRQISVANVLERTPYFHTIAPHQTLREVLDVFARTHEVVLPVAASADAQASRYTGLVFLEDLQALLHEADTLSPLILAQDVQVPFVALHLSDSLEEALERFLETRYPALPALDAQGAIVGFLRPHQLISEYHRALLRSSTASSSHDVS